MPAMKRPAGAVQTSASKKQAVRPVLKAIADASEPAFEVLSSMLPFSLGEYKADRDPRQEELIAEAAMILEKMTKEKEAKVAELEAQAKGLDADKLARQEAQAAAAAPLPSLEAKVSEATAALNAAKEAVKDAQKASIDAVAAQKKGDEPYEAALARRTQLAEALEKHLAPAREAKATARAVKALIEVAKKFGFDSTLVSSAHLALEKAPEKRGDFDKVVITQIEQAFEKKTAAIAEELSALEPGKTERAEAAKSAAGAAEASKGKQEEAAAALGTAKAALKEGKDALKDAEDKVKSWLSDAKKVFDAVDDSKRELSEFVDGPVAAFEELRHREAPQEEPEESEALEAETKAAPDTDAAMPEAAPEGDAAPAADAISEAPVGVA